MLRTIKFLLLPTIMVASLAGCISSSSVREIQSMDPYVQGARSKLATDSGVDELYQNVPPQFQQAGNCTGGFSAKIRTQESATYNDFSKTRVGDVNCSRVYLFPHGVPGS